MSGFELCVKRLAAVFCFVGVLMFGAGMAMADNIYWTDWTSATAGNRGSSIGTITLENFASISVDYSGEIFFAQTSGGTDYWLPSAPYISSEISNAPSSSDIIALRGGNSILNTITFSAPVENPVMGIVSLGNPVLPIRYQFDAAFDVLSVGNGYWGNGTLTELTGNVLEGGEGHGAIQFIGTYSSISWTVPVYENWHGFTVGIEGVQEPVSGTPEPATMLLLCTGFIGLAVLRKKFYNWTV